MFGGPLFTNPALYTNKFYQDICQTNNDYSDLPYFHLQDTIHKPWLASLGRCEISLRNTHCLSHLTAWVVTSCCMGTVHCLGRAAVIEVMLIERMPFTDS